MKSLWRGAEAAQFSNQFPGPLAPRVYGAQVPVEGENERVV